MESWEKTKNICKLKTAKNLIIHFYSLYVTLSFSLVKNE